MYCYTCEVYVTEIYDVPTVTLQVTSMSIGSNTVSFRWDITASGGFGEKSYSCIVYERNTGNLLALDAYYGYSGACNFSGSNICARVYLYDEIGVIVYDFIINNGNGTTSRPGIVVEKYHANNS